MSTKALLKGILQGTAADPRKAAQILAGAFSGAPRVPRLRGTAKLMAAEKAGKLARVKSAIAGVAAARNVVRRAIRNRKSRGPMESRTSAPVAMGTITGYRGPKGPRTHVVSNSEYVADVSGSVAYACTSLALNPGLPLFAWLAAQAKEWQQYRFVSLAIRYVPRCATSTLGTVVLSPDYAATDKCPGTLREASNTEDSISGPPWTELVCRLNPRAMHPTGPRKFVRNGPVVGDLLQYDVGSMNISVVGMADTSTVGQVWLDYSVEFMVPQSSLILGMPSPRGLSAYTFSTDQGFTALSTVLQKITWKTCLFDGCRLGLVVGTGIQDILLPPGSYMMTVMFTLQFTGAPSGQEVTVRYGGWYNSGADSSQGLSSDTYAVLTGGALYKTYQHQYVFCTDGTAGYSAGAAVTYTGSWTSKAYLGVSPSGCSGMLLIQPC